MTAALIFAGLLITSLILFVYLLVTAPEEENNDERK